MAKRTVVEWYDDLDGGPASTTVRFGLDGTEYEIDLSDGNAAKLRSLLGRYVEVARMLTPTGRPYQRTLLDADPRAIRAWATRNGVDCPPSGRIPSSVREKWRAAQDPGNGKVG